MGTPLSSTPADVGSSEAADNAGGKKTGKRSGGKAASASKRGRADLADEAMEVDMERFKAGVKAEVCVATCPSAPGH